MELFDYIIMALAALIAGIVNAIAGGGTLLTFPMLTFLGIPAVVANVTNTVALSPGYIGGMFSQRKDFRGQGRRLWIFMPVGIFGGVAGGLLLLKTGEKSFREVVPWLILFASLILALQPYIRKWISRFQDGRHPRLNTFWFILLTIPAAVYGGYFGAGVSVIIMAILGLLVNDTMNRLNALKQSISFAINGSTAIFFMFTADVEWVVALIMAAGSILGGMAGGRIATNIKPGILRWAIVVIGILVSIVYFVK